MTRPWNAEVEDAHQERTLAEQEARRAEKRLARQIAAEELVLDVEQTWQMAVLGIVVTLALFGIALAIVVTLAYAWHLTGDVRFLWYLALSVVGMVVGFSCLFRKHPDEVDR